jgi:hypothetical protein
MSEFDWRSPTAYKKMQKAEAADFAWEYLRRNNDYREDYRNRQKIGSIAAADAAFRQRWGFLFAADPVRRSTHRPSSGRQRCCRPSLAWAGERRNTRAPMMSILASYQAPISGGRRMAGIQSFGWQGGLTDFGCNGFRPRVRGSSLNCPSTPILICNRALHIGYGQPPGGGRPQDRVPACLFSDARWRPRPQR